MLRWFFEETSDGWRQKRCDEELEKYAEKSAKAAASASARWGKSQSEGNANVSTDAMRTHRKRTSERNASHKPVTNNQEKSKGTARKRATHVPENFVVSDRVRAWAAEKGFDRIDEHLEAFKRKCSAKGYEYVDHDAAFMEAIREDWAKLRGTSKDGKAQAPIGAPPAVSCGNCAKPITGGWSQSPKGRVCDPCHRGYMDGAWPLKAAA